MPRRGEKTKKFTSFKYKTASGREVEVPVWVIEKNDTTTTFRATDDGLDINLYDPNINGLRQKVGELVAARSGIKWERFLLLTVDYSHGYRPSLSVNFQPYQVGVGVDGQEFYQEMAREDRGPLTLTDKWCRRAVRPGRVRVGPRVRESYQNGPKTEEGYAVLVPWGEAAIRAVARLEEYVEKAQKDARAWLVWLEEQLAKEPAHGA